MQISALGFCCLRLLLLGNLAKARFCYFIRKKRVMLVKIEKWIYIIFCWHKTSGTDITEFGWRNISFLLDKRKMSKVNFFDILNQKKIWLGRNNFDFQHSNFPPKRFWREIWIWIIIVKWYYRWCDAGWHVAKFLNLICQILFWKKDSKIHDWQGV